MDKQKIRLAYVLNVEVVVERRADLIQLLRRQTENIRFVELRRAATLPVERLGEAVVRSDLGFSVRVPHGWSIRYTKDGLILQQMDYLLRQPIPVVQIAVLDQSPLTTSREVAETYSAVEKENATKQGLEVEVAKAGEEKTIDGEQAYQFIMHERVGIPQPGMDTTPLTVTLRAAVRLIKEGKAAKAYLVRGVHYGKDPVAANAVVEKIVSGFKFVPFEEPATATAPAATAPAPATPATGAAEDKKPEALKDILP